MCEADEVEYEFVVDGLAFSRCRACTLLFANPYPGVTDAPPSPATEAAYPALRAFAARYLGREPNGVLIVDTGAAPSDAAAIRRAAGELAPSTTATISSSRPACSTARPTRSPPRPRCAASSHRAARC